MHLLQDWYCELEAWLTIISLKMMEPHINSWIYVIGQNMQVTAIGAVYGIGTLLV